MNVCLATRQLFIQKPDDSATTTITNKQTKKNVVNSALGEKKASELVSTFPSFITKKHLDLLKCLNPFDCRRPFIIISPQKFFFFFLKENLCISNDNRIGRDSLGFCISITKRNFSIGKRLTISKEPFKYISSLSIECYCSRSKNEKKS